MKYSMLGKAERSALMSELADMPDYLARAFESLAADDATEPGPDGGLGPVEQCWHLADLEREGFGVRIHRLLTEREPHLPDFDGAAVARERVYRSRSLTEGIAVFRAARRENLAALAALRPEDWTRAGTQDGIGAVALCDIPAMMAEHDAGHRREIETWRQRAVSDRNRLS
jgi:DinB superfamily